MTDFLHALYSILIAGSVFIGLVLLERWHLIQQQRPNAHDTQETLANFSAGILYKVVDGIFIALVVTVFYAWVGSGV